MRSNVHELPEFRAAFRLLEQRLHVKFENQAEFEDLVRAGLHFTLAPDIEPKITLMRSGYFSAELLQATVSAGESFHTGPVNYMWERLRSRAIVTSAVGSATGVFAGAFVDHTLNSSLLLEYLQSDTLMNIFAPTSALPSRYSDAIVSIDVTTRDGPSRGTGFLVSSDRGVTLVTCRHVVDPTEGISVDRVTTSSGRMIDAGKLELHPHADVAAMEVVPTVDRPLFALSSDVAVFDDVYSLGYPAVPLALDPGLVGHRGEVNGRVTTYTHGNELLLISNLISPGNSGGPVLDRDGSCIGMSTQWLESGTNAGLLRYSAAVPADVIETWLQNRPNP